MVRQGEAALKCFLLMPLYNLSTPWCSPALGLDRRTRTRCHARVALSRLYSARYHNRYGCICIGDLSCSASYRMRMLFDAN